MKWRIGVDENRFKKGTKEETQEWGWMRRLPPAVARTAGRGGREAQRLAHAERRKRNGKGPKVAKGARGASQRTARASASRFPRSPSPSAARIDRCESDPASRRQRTPSRLGQARAERGRRRLGALAVGAAARSACLLLRASSTRHAFAQDRLSRLP